MNARDRINELIEEGVDEKWWGQVNRTKDEYYSLMNRFRSIEGVKVLEHSLFLNEINVEVSKDNQEDVNDIVRSDEYLYFINVLDKGDTFENIISTNTWLKNEHYVTSEIEHSRYVENFLRNELSLLIAVREVNFENGFLLVECDLDMKSAVELKEITSQFNLNLVSFSLEEGKKVLTYDTGNMCYDTKNIVISNELKIKNFVNYFLLKEIGVRIDGERYFLKDSVGQIENLEGMEFKKVFEKKLVSKSGSVIENPNLEEAFYYEYNKDLNIPFVDLTDPELKNKYRRYFKKMLEEKTKNRLIDLDQVIKYDEENF